MLKIQKLWKNIYAYTYAFMYINNQRNIFCMSRKTKNCDKDAISFTISQSENSHQKIMSKSLFHNRLTICFKNMYSASDNLNETNQAKTKIIKLQDWKSRDYLYSGRSCRSRTIFLLLNSILLWALPLAAAFFSIHPSPEHIIQNLFLIF